MATPTLSGLAFLGPAGTYSHQAACNRFEDSVEYYERNTIADVFNAVSDAIPLALIPQENSLYGSVIETYDLLRLPCAGGDKFIVGEVTHSIRHSLLVREGATLTDIKRVLSHEQALGQCSHFIKTHLPDVTLVRVPSTAAAAAAISASGENARTDAAICSKHCQSIFAGLEVLREGIQDRDSNITRFFILSTTRDFNVPARSAAFPQHVLLRIGLRSQQSMTDVLKLIGLDIVRIDRRPLLNGEPFDNYYFIELCNPSKDVYGPTNGGFDWTNQVERGIARLQDNNFDCTLLGIW